MIGEALAAAVPEARERAVTAAVELLDALDEPAAKAAGALMLVRLGKEPPAAIERRPLWRPSPRRRARTAPGRGVYSIAIVAYGLDVDGAPLAAAVRARLRRMLERTAPEDGAATVAAGLAFLEARAGEAETARAFLARAHESIGAVADAVSRSQGWPLMAEAHASLDEIDAAVAAAQRIEDDGDRAAMVVAPATGRVEAGNLEGAGTLLERAGTDPPVFLSLDLVEATDALADAHEERGEDEAAAAVRGVAQNVRDLYNAHAAEACTSSRERRGGRARRPGLRGAARCPVSRWEPRALLDLCLP